MVRAPIFHQRRLGAPATACGWPSKGPLSLFEAIRADFTVVTDLPSFHTGYPLPEGFEITGPVFADDGTGAHAGSAELDADVGTALRRDGQPAILLTMGSSGTPELLLEAIHALVPPPRTVPVVTLLPTSGMCWSWPRPQCVRWRTPGPPRRGALAFW
jgi:hypothetical protein